MTFLMKALTFLLASDEDRVMHFQSVAAASITGGKPRSRLSEQQNLHPITVGLI